MIKVTVDTSVIIEYIDTKGELHEQSEAVFSALLRGNLEAILPHPTLAEMYYVATKLYDRLRVEKPHFLASKLIEWIYRLPTVTVPSGDATLSIEAGKVKLKYGLALTDCYVLAASKIHGCKALFKKQEKEMSNDLERLEKEYQLIFLERYK